ncbi:hypothetical protein BYZ73_02085 [Rhodovulum viride]|uniref:FHA domain-containing protein n=1 Tax=Rhodovulum viride TaxID=1231134 RepID=A0ABX9DKR5_9RHOB|nr:FHA domain-containing protein [Rhodovulum viride]RAP42990.1 hypothetical protein BYZ73_02085 [Rhodovulum viride]
MDFLRPKPEAEDGPAVRREVGPLDAPDPWGSDLGTDAPIFGSIIRENDTGSVPSLSAARTAGVPAARVPTDLDAPMADIPHRGSERPMTRLHSMVEPLTPETAQDAQPRSLPQTEAAGRAPPPPAGQHDDLSALAIAAPAARQSLRARTRFLGFGAPEAETADPFAGHRPAPAEAETPADRPDLRRFPVGWLVVTAGPGRGAHFALFSGVSQIGRGPDQAVRLDFGDTAISRSGHALLAYDDEQGLFYLGSGGKANIVRLNGRPLLSTEELSHEDEIRLGETRLRFIALCGPGFAWNAPQTGPDADDRTR